MDRSRLAPWTPLISAIRAQSLGPYPERYTSGSGALSGLPHLGHLPAAIVCYIHLYLRNFDHLMAIKFPYRSDPNSSRNGRLPVSKQRRASAQFLPMPFVSLLAPFISFALFGLFLRLFEGGVRGRRLVRVLGIPVQPRFDLFESSCCC